MHSQDFVLTDNLYEPQAVISEVMPRKRTGSLLRTLFLAAKRGFDIGFSLLALILLSPLLLLIACIIKLDSKGCIFFKQKRVGKDGKPFLIFKFRTMSLDAPKEVASCKLSNPYRYITRIGRFLRRTSIDELPQLFNILKGDMTVIGPRPLVLSEKQIHILRKNAGVYAVRPGITGWAQVNGRDELSIWEKVEKDRYYTRNMSALLDCKIFFKTIFVVFKRLGYNEGLQKD